MPCVQCCSDAECAGLTRALRAWLQVKASVRNFLVNCTSPFTKTSDKGSLPADCTIIKTLKYNHEGVKKVITKLPSHESMHHTHLRPFLDMQCMRTVTRHPQPARRMYKDSTKGLQSIIRMV
jgi:hypothetical protein